MPSSIKWQDQYLKKYGNPAFWYQSRGNSVLSVLIPLGEKHFMFVAHATSRPDEKFKVTLGENERIIAFANHILLTNRFVRFLVHGPNAFVPRRALGSGLDVRIRKHPVDLWSEARHYLQDR